MAGGAGSQPRQKPRDQFHSDALKCRRGGDSRVVKVSNPTHNLAHPVLNDCLNNFAWWRRRRRCGLRVSSLSSSSAHGSFSPASLKGPLLLQVHLLPFLLLFLLLLLSIHSFSFCTYFFLLPLSLAALPPSLLSLPPNNSSPYILTPFPTTPVSLHLYHHIQFTFIACLTQPQPLPQLHFCPPFQTSTSNNSFPPSLLFSQNHHRHLHVLLHLSSAH